MKKKSLLIFIMVMLLCINSVVLQAFAVGGNVKPDLVSKEEFVSAFMELHKKYDLKCEVIDDSNYNPITREEFESIFNRIEKGLIDSFNELNKDNEKLQKLLKEDGLSAINDITPNAQWVIRGYEGRKYVEHSTGLAFVNIKYGSWAELNINNGEYGYVDSPGLWYYDIAVGLEDIDYERNEWFITSMGYKVVASAAGLVTFSYTIGGVKFSSQQPFSIYSTYDQYSDYV
ncbi:MAG: hypothetical protein GX289_08760 [Tissierellia bacterium]|jgi:hypothetical protein|nr:hypothetical protein [Tissierellia bacterium]